MSLKKKKINLIKKTHTPTNTHKNNGKRCERLWKQLYTLRIKKKSYNGENILNTFLKTKCIKLWAIYE